MEKLEKIEIAAKDLIRYYCPNYTFMWDRSTRRKGQCRYGSKQIGISKPIAELNTFECMMLTVIHEIAHALTKCGHKKRWKELCISLGGDGQTYYNANETITPKGWILYRDGLPTSIKRVRRFKVGYLSGLTWRREKVALDKSSF